MEQDIDKLLRSLQDGLEVYTEFESALEDDNKVDIWEGSAIVIKYGGKAMRFISALKEIGLEIADIDGEEMSILMTNILNLAGGSDETKDALNDIAIGAGRLNQGMKKLIKIKKSKG